MERAGRALPKKIYQCGMLRAFPTGHLDRTMRERTVEYLRLSI